MTALAPTSPGGDAPRWTGWAVIPFRFKLALTLSGESTVPGPDGTLIHVATGHPFTSATGVEQVWFALRYPHIAEQIGYTLPDRVRVVTPAVAEVVA